MQDIFTTLDFPTALTVVMLSAFGIALRTLWRYFTTRIDKLDAKIDELYKENVQLQKKYDALWSEIAINVLDHNSSAAQQHTRKED